MTTLGATVRTESGLGPAVYAVAGGLFLSYMTIGTGLPVIPIYVHQTLGLGDVLVGLAIGIQFVATVLTRGFAGRVADQDGAHRSMRSGMAVCAVAGAGLIVVAAAPLPPAGRFVLLLLARLALGFGESQLVVGAVAWGIGLAGQARAGRVLALMGMAMYGAVAVGAPVGLWLDRWGGLAAIGAANTVLPAAGLLLVARVLGVAPPGGQRQKLRAIVGLIWRSGLAVGLQGVGFAAIGAFISLDFLTQGWPGAGLALTCFGGAFVAVRILCGRLPDRVGGAKVAAVSLAVEAVGQGLLWLAPHPGVALVGAAVTGCGCSMVFPSFGLEVVKRVPPQSRGVALGGFAAFQDVAYGVTGPLAGLAASRFGYPSVFALGAVAAVAGLGLAVAALRGDAVNGAR